MLYDTALHCTIFLRLRSVPPYLICGSRSARGKLDADLPSQGDIQFVLSVTFDLCGRKITQHESGRSLPVRPMRPAMAGM